jgi:hypothetical protein
MPVILGMEQHFYTLYIREIILEKHLWMLLFDEQMNANRFSTGSCLSIRTPAKFLAT